MELTTSPCTEFRYNLNGHSRLANYRKTQNRSFWGACRFLGKKKCVPSNAAWSKRLGSRHPAQRRKFRMARMDAPTKVSMKGISLSPKCSCQRPEMTQQVQKPWFLGQFRLRPATPIGAGRGICTPPRARSRTCRNLIGMAASCRNLLQRRVSCLL